MNLTESHAAQTVIAWLADLQLVETGPDAPSDARLLEAVAVLADRSHRALGAGHNRDAAVAAVTAVLTDIPPAAAAPTPARTAAPRVPTPARTTGFDAYASTDQGADHA